MIHDWVAIGIAVVAAVFTGFGAWHQRGQRRAADRSNAQARLDARNAYDDAKEARRLAAEANSIAHEALEHQRAQSQVLLRIESEIRPISSTTVPDDALSHYVVALVKNIGSVEARVAEISLRNGTRGLRAVHIEGDIADKPMRSVYPFTLLPGSRCEAHFKRQVVNERTGGWSWQPLQYESDGTFWNTLEHVQVDASNETYTSQANDPLEGFAEMVTQAIFKKRLAAGWKPDPIYGHLEPPPEEGSKP